MTTPVSKTPEKNTIKAVVDEHGYAAGIEAQVDGIGMSIPVEQFCAIDAAIALPRATFSANGIRREIFVDTANNTAYVRRIREKDAKVVAVVEEVHDVVVEHIEKGAEILITVSETKKTSSTALIQGGLDAATAQPEKLEELPSPPLFVSPAQGGSMVFMSWNTWSEDNKDSKSFFTQKVTAQPISISSESDLIIRGATTLTLPVTAHGISARIASSTEDAIVTGPTETEHHSVADSKPLAAGRLDFNDNLKEVANYAATERMLSVDNAVASESETSLRAPLPLRGPGLFEKLSAMIASFKQTNESVSDLITTPIMPPLSTLIPALAIAPKPSSKDIPLVDLVLEGEGSRDSSDGQQHSQEEQHQGQQSAYDEQEQHQESFA